MTAAVHSATAEGVPAASHSSLRFTGDVAELAAIYEPDVNVVTLERTPSSGLLDGGRRAARETGFRKLFSLTAERAREVVSAELGDFPHVAADVAFWVEALSELTGAGRIGVRLARIESAMCPRFHVDRVTLRVISTYEGRGTELIAHEHADRTQLGLEAPGTLEELRGVLLAPGRVRTVRPFDVVFLKGEAWQDMRASVPSIAHQRRAPSRRVW